MSEQVPEAVSSEAPKQYVVLYCESCESFNRLAHARDMNEARCGTCGKPLVMGAAAPSADRSQRPPEVERSEFEGPDDAAFLDRAERAKLENSIRSGGSWFYWIAGISLANTVANWMGMNVSFALGLGITQVIDAFVGGSGGVALAIARLLNGLAAALFVAFGKLAIAKKQWAFVAGLTLYGFDTLIFLLVKDVLSIGLHALAIGGLVVGWRALRKLLADDRARTEAARPRIERPAPQAARRSVFGG